MMPAHLRKLAFFCLAALSLQVFAGSVRAEETAEPPELHLFAGAFEVGFGGTRFLTWETGLELRLHAQEKHLKLGRLELRLTPIIGFGVTGDDGYWLYGGSRSEWPLSERWTVGLSSAVGLFEDGVGLELGGRVEFRSAIDLNLELGDGQRVALTLHHLSNAGLYSLNPGSESLLLSYGFRLGKGR